MNGKELLANVKGKTVNLEDRIDKAIHLASWMQIEANRRTSFLEKVYQSVISRILHDPNAKVFTTELLDQAFRSQSNTRVRSQIDYLIKIYGMPKYFTWFGVNFIKAVMRKATSKVILPEEEGSFIKHLNLRYKQDVRINLNHLGEAILGEQEADNRLNRYLEDLRQPEVEYISVKISTLYSQINLLAWEATLEKLAKPLRALLSTAGEFRFTYPNGSSKPKFVNLDMEEYRDLRLTVALFKKVLSEEPFLHTSAGIVLQSYLPDSFAFQQDLTQFALERVQRGGAPIKIRLVKGANLAMEKFEAYLKNWPQATYEHKWETDGHFKRMLEFGLRPENSKAVKIGVGSHNLFDIAYALIMRSEREVQADVTFEMLEGMAEPLRRVVQELSGDMLLYCPVAKAEDFHNAIAYLVRRLDENTGHDHFLRVAFGLTPGTHSWQHQANLFAHACQNELQVSSASKRTQNRLLPPIEDLFINELDTDFALPANREWAEEIVKEPPDTLEIPLVIGGIENCSQPQGRGIDPSLPHKELFRYQMATKEDIDTCLKTAIACPKNSMAHLLPQVAKNLRSNRQELLAAMLFNTAKPISEGDPEVSEAIDFCTYYHRSYEELMSLNDLKCTPKGVVLVASPWNFSCSIPVSGIAAALATGNAVIFKPAPEAIWVGYTLVKLFWEAGISKSQLQFLLCTDEIASMLVQDPRLDGMILTGATATAKQLLTLRPGLDLMAETGGKNSIIVTAMADRDLSLKEIVHSAFSYSGQKCSACSVLILEEEVYNNPHFKKQLKDAVQSLVVGSARDLSTKINPLIRPPEGSLSKAVEALEEGEEWLLKPHQDRENPHLLYPGIKWGVRPVNFVQQNELFGPLLAVIKAKDLKDAIEIANSTPYGLTAGLHSLDEREHHIWLQHIQAGNCYINRGITGAIVERQPFGGTKASSFGPGAKAGGPNYIKQLMNYAQIAPPEGRAALSPEIQNLIQTLPKEDQELALTSASNYSFYWKHFFSQDHDPTKILGQINIQRYLPHPTYLRLSSEDTLIDLVRVFIAAQITSTPLAISSSHPFPVNIPLCIESEEQFVKRISQEPFPRLRLLRPPSPWLNQALSSLGCYCHPAPVLANGRIELLHYLREVSISYDYHRYGYLATKEIV